MTLYDRWQKALAERRVIEKECNQCCVDYDLCYRYQDAVKKETEAWVLYQTCAS